MIEDQLIRQFHQARLKQMVAVVIDALKSVRPGGLYEGRAACQTLWDEVCFAIQDTEDEAASGAAEDTIWQFASAHTSDILPAEFRLHAYLLSEESDDAGLPIPDIEAFVRELQDEVTHKAAHRSLADLELE